MLREAREAQALSLEEVEAHTRIRVKFLEALEMGDLSVLPSSMHAKGFLRSYAQFLQLNVPEVIERFNVATGVSPRPVTQLTTEPAALAEPLHRGETLAEDEAVDGAGADDEVSEASDEAAAEPEPVEVDQVTDEEAMEDDILLNSEPPTVAPEIRRTTYVAPEQWVGPSVPAALRRTAQNTAEPPSVPPGAGTAPPEGRAKPQGVPSRVLGSNIFTIAVLLVGFALIIWWVTTRLSAVSGDDLGAAATQDDSGLAALVTNEAATSTPTFAPTSTQAADSGPQILDRVVLSIDMVQRSWVYIEVDGEAAYEGQAAPGEVLNYEGAEQIFIRAGNGAGLDVTYNGQNIGTLGERGQIVERMFLVGGYVTPTPTPTLTPTNTGVPTATPRSTFTPTPQNTGIPTVTPSPSPTPSRTPTTTRTPTPTSTRTPSPTP